MTLRRVLWLALTAALLFSAWSMVLAWQVRGDLAAVERSASDFRRAVEDGDRPAQEQALVDLRDAAADADERTHGVTWAVLKRLPLVGDDATGVQALSGSVRILAEEGAEPMLNVYRLADQITGDGGVDLAVVEKMHGDVTEAHAAFADAADLVSGLDSSGYAGPVRGRFDRYVDTVVRADSTLGSAVTAVDVLPSMLGKDGPRDYLLVFQNNAEIRATGGMPGSWAQLHADDGKLSLTRQGSAGDFPFKPRPVLPLSEAERTIYDGIYAQYFQDIGFAPDWPRAAELARAHWDVRFPQTDLDGVIGLDPVAMSYLLDGTGPITVAGRELTSDNAVEGLLSTPYLELDTEAQDAFFAQAARTLFDAAVGGLGDPLAFAEGLTRAASEDRLLVAAFDDDIDARLAETDVRGELSGDDGSTPHVDIGLNDATQSKMSYYLRHIAEVEATGCRDGRQRLMGTMTLSQTISPEEARQLSESVTGGANPTAARGEQLVFVRIYGPYGGTVQDVTIDGRSLDREIDVVDDRGRPVVTVFVQLSNTKDVLITWAMDSGEGQTGDGELWMTPGVTPGAKGGTFESAC